MTTTTTYSRRNLEVGDEVRIKTYDKRPIFWNDNGHMDKYMGRIVTIDYIDSSSFRINSDHSDPQNWWFLFEHIEEKISSISIKEYLLSEELFEI